MRTSRVNRVATITVIAMTAALGVTGTADAASTHASANALPTSLSIDVDPHSISHGQKAVVHGVLRSGKTGLAHEVVHLYWAVGAGKKFTEIGKSITNATGMYALVIHPPATRLCRAGFNGSSKFAASHSRVYRVTVA
jgi:hypothetical protein